MAGVAGPHGESDAPVRREIQACSGQRRPRRDGRLGASGRDTVPTRAQSRPISDRAQDGGGPVVTGDTRYVVQFPHPGPERIPKPGTVGSQLSWNTGEHGRKFLLAPGAWTDGSTSGHGNLTFWGEWEAQSCVAAVLERGPGLPRVLQLPYWNVPNDGAWRQNTDPLVFGDRFIWSNCRQHQNAKLRRVAPGSLVLFGSKVRGRFALDTAFVVADSASYRPIDGVADGGPLDSLVFDPLSLNDGDAGKTFRLYRGATPDASLSGLFSFVPCMPYDG